MGRSHLSGQRRHMGKESLRMEATEGDQERSASSVQVDRQHNSHCEKWWDAEGGGPRTMEDIGKGLYQAVGT
ncbi:hypothetical protein RR48_12621 [Papilio machaon]|uniref:Uncharacterized protein n=1 Tax=Papilio machaon TaxID=76193 RepID=A0A194RP74_PAPMA|nr:hypothetical protein RR48_12621 [Papilio machaon]